MVLEGISSNTPEPARLIASAKASSSSASAKVPGTGSPPIER